MIKIFTDGSSKGNPGPGGSGVAVYNTQRNELLAAFSKQYEHTTNNQAELNALLYAMHIAREDFKGEYCIIYSDSAYCVNMCNDWIWNWADNGWKNSKNKTVENLDLVQPIYRMLSAHEPNFEIQKIKAHVGEIGNELADALATDDELKFNKILEENDVKYSLKYYFDNFQKI